MPRASMRRNASALWSGSGTGWPALKCLVKSSSLMPAPCCNAATIVFVELERLKAGMTGSAELRVGKEHVLATPVMINLIEAAALDAVERLLPPGYQSLGTLLQVRHIAATPVGMRINAKVEVTRVEGRTIFFRVRVFDEIELIGDGSHERVVVNVAKFDARVQRKLNPP